MAAAHHNGAVAVGHDKPDVMARVVFTPSGLSATVDDGTSVLDAARTLGADLDSTCGGRGLCGRCQVVPSFGSFAKWNIESSPNALTEVGPIENEYRGRRPLEAPSRLGCAAKVCGDVVVEIPPASHVHRPVVRKSVDVGDIEIDPLVRLHYIELPTVEFGDDTADALGGLAEQVGTALLTDYGISMARLDANVLPLLAPAAKHGNNAVTVAVRFGRDVCGVYPGYVDRAFGVAIDVGSTTIAGHLVDLASGEVVATHGAMNPQIRFGDDLMSRVSYVMMNPGGDVELTSTIRSGLDELITDLRAAASAALGIEVGTTHVLDVTIVGNPVIHHTVLGIDPTPLGQAPFTLATDSAVQLRATEIDLDAPFAAVYVLPCIAGHVGADTAAAILAEGPHRSTEMQLLVDVGTNAEIVLGNTERLLAASSPTGPAFEGAQVSAGMRATTGAIERVRIDRDSLEPRFKVIGSDLWSDDSDFADNTADFDIAGLCGSGIIEVLAELFLAGLIDTDGTIRSDGPSKTDRVVAHGRTFAYRLYGEGDGAILVTQDDVRAIQLAKAALRAGIDLLCEHAGLTDLQTIGSVRLAGAFGAHIDPLYAKVLGLVPDVPVDSIRSVGNAAGAGAVRALVSGGQRAEIEETVRRVEKIETATEPRFQELFVQAMGFPHTSTPTPLLAAETTLPTAQAPAAANRTRRGGRRSGAPQS